MYQYELHRCDDVHRSCQNYRWRVADPTKLDNGIEVVIATLLAIIWNLVTWWFGLPSSSSHALIGALAGAVFVGAGSDMLNYGGFKDIVLALILSPILAFVIGYVVMHR